MTTPEPKFKFDVQGLVRTAITIATIVSIYYVDRATLREGVDDNRRDLSVLAADVKNHIDAFKMQKFYTLDELNERFVPRREWESNHKLLRDDMRYLRAKIDAIFDKVSK
nr:MAG TPA: hypothetical protein [Caudoviricetes sp.]